MSPPDAPRPSASAAPLRLAIAGAGGRMGRTLVKACAETDGVVLGAATEREGSEWLGTDAGSLAGAGAAGVAISARLPLLEFDTVIDFTSPASTLDNVEACAGAERSIVIGTTGLNADHEAALAESATSVPIIYAPNMSVGVNLSFCLAELAARVMGSASDIEIIEAHHRHKVDAPSGTALGFGRAVAKGAGIDLDEHAIYAREGITGPRPDGAIGFSTIRAGDIVGEHTAMFASAGERIEVTHRATSRMNFANGALRAALWLRGKPPGLYSMQQVLGLDKLLGNADA